MEGVVLCLKCLGMRWRIGRLRCRKFRHDDGAGLAMMGKFRNWL